MVDQSVKYEEIGKNYRFFLTWRYGIFAAYLFVLWSSFSISFKLLEKKVDPIIIGSILFVSSIIILCLWIAEQRNRELYRGLIEKGKELEDSNNQAYRILYDLSKVNKQWRIITQSISLDILGYICLIAFFNSAVILFNKPDYLNFNLADINTFSWTLIAIIDIAFFILIDPLGLKYIPSINKKLKKWNILND